MDQPLEERTRQWFEYMTQVIQEHPMWSGASEKELIIARERLKSMSCQRFSKSPLAMCGAER